MKYYFDESGDAGLKIEKGSSGEFSIAIIATNDSTREIELLKQTTRIKTIKKWHSTSAKHRKIINDVLALQLISFSKKIQKSKIAYKDPNELMFNSIKQLIEEIPENKIKIYYEGEHLKKIFAKIQKKTYKKITFIPAQDKEDKLGVLLADLVAGSIRSK